MDFFGLQGSETKTLPEHLQQHESHGERLKMGIALDTIHLDPFVYA